MAEDHSKYMPHHPKPKFANGGKPKLQDPMLRQRAEPTSHAGSGDTPYSADSYNSYHDTSNSGVLNSEAGYESMQE